MFTCVMLTQPAGLSGRGCGHLNYCKGVTLNLLSCHGQCRLFPAHLPLSFKGYTIVQLERGLLSQDCLQSVNSIEIMPFLHKYEVTLFKEAPSCGNGLML